MPGGRLLFLLLVDVVESSVSLPLPLLLCDREPAAGFLNTPDKLVLGLVDTADCGTVRSDDDGACVLGDFVRSIAGWLAVCAALPDGSVWLVDFGSSGKAAVVVGGSVVFRWSTGIGFVGLVPADLLDDGRGPDCFATLA